MKNKVQQLKFILLSLLVVIAVINANAQSSGNYVRPDSCTGTGISQTAIGYGSQCAGTTGADNTSIGNLCLASVTSGVGNTAAGANALYGTQIGNASSAFGTNTLTNFNPTDGSVSDAYGAGALKTAITGTNDAFGSQALFTLSSSGTGNVAMGPQALYSTTSSYNTAVGYQSAYYSTGSSNSCLGYLALYNNTTGSNNVAVGYEAIYNALDTATNNTAVGYNAGWGLTGARNTCMGSGALYGTGSASNAGDGNNVAIGYYAMNAYITGTDNCVVGTNAAKTLTGGSYNVAIGSNALGTYNASMGANYNTALGYDAGAAYAAYTTCTFLGANADAGGNSYSNATAVGYMAASGGSGQIQLGNTSVAGVYLVASKFYNGSDRRFKKDIQQNVPGIEFIKRLRPVTYHFDMHTMDELIYGDRTTQYEKEMGSAIAEKEKILNTGFIAQEVEQAAKESNYDFSGVYVPKNDKQYYSLAYSDFVVPLVKAVQEQQQMIDTQATVIEKLQQTVELQLTTIKSQQEVLTSQTARLQEIETQLQSLQDCCYGSGEQKSLNNLASPNQPQLLYAAPNPTSNGTTIYYYAPENSKSVSILIKNGQGENIKTVPAPNSGSSSVNVATSDLASGVYYYSLIIDSKIADTKKLVITLK